MQKIEDLSNLGFLQSQYNPVINKATSVTALHTAALFKFRLAIDYILENVNNIDINVKDANGQTPLYMAVLDPEKKKGEYKGKEDIETVRKLLQHGANPYESGKEAATPINLAKDTNKNQLYEILTKLDTTHEYTCIAACFAISTNREFAIIFVHRYPKV